MKGERETLMKIRKAEAQDAKAIYAVVTAAFAGAEHTDGNEADLVMALTASRS
ncbi:GNAT family N-acetyltransferase, partial [Streptococcus pyogenes]